MSPSGCTHPVYRITKVMRSAERHFDVLRNEHYHALKVYVVLPESPVDYVASAHVSGRNIAVPLQDEEAMYYGDSNRRRLPGWTVKTGDFPQFTKEALRKCKTKGTLPDVLEKAKGDKVELAKALAGKTKKEVNADETNRAVVGAVWCKHKVCYVR